MTSYFYFFMCMCLRIIILDIFCWYKQPLSAIWSLVFSSVTSKSHWDPCWSLFFNAENDNKQFLIYRRPSAYTVFTAIFIFKFLFLFLFSFSFLFFESQLLLLKIYMHLDGKRLTHPCVYVCTYTYICIYMCLKLLLSRNRYILFIIIYLWSN